MRDGDVILIFSDGFHDNVYDSGMPYCIEEYLYDGLVTSLSQAADCLARKSYFLGKSQDFRSPWMAEYKFYNDNDITLLYPERKDYPFLGGKHDDITVTVAQVFRDDRGADDPRKMLAKNDPFFTEQKTLYTGPVPLNNKESFFRARFRANDIPEGVSPQFNVEETRAKVNVHREMLESMQEG